MPLRAIIAATAMLMLAACQDEAAKERACYDKLSADFNGYAERAKVLRDHKGALQAYESALAASLIHSDDDRSVCDYVSAGPYLERK